MSALRVARVPLRDGQLLDGQYPAGTSSVATQALGALVYGTRGVPGRDSGRLAGARLGGVNARLLFPEIAMADAWHTDGSVVTGTTGAVHWRSNGRWTLGHVELDDGAGTLDDPQALERQAHKAYLDLFQALRDTDCPHLLRVWNYLPRINADGGGLERYRQFNLGRQTAFIDAGHSAFDGAPAACALGIVEGTPVIHFLAGQRAPVPIENPRQVSAYRYPTRYGPRAPTFSRAALAELGDGELALFISGTASIVGHESVHPGDVTAQTRETLRNLRAVIDAARQRTDAAFGLSSLDAVVYVRHARDLPAVRGVLDAEAGADSRTVRQAVYLEADVCREDLLVEIEAHAVAPGRLHA